MIKIEQGIEKSFGRTSSISVSKIDKIIFTICILDILFLPYIQMFSISISMVLLPIWFMLNLNKIKITTDFKLFIPFFSLMILSLMLSFILFDNSPFLFTNVKYAAFLMLGFLYFFFFKFYIETNQIDLSKYLRYYILFGFSLSLVYFADLQLYYLIRSYWSLSGTVVEVTNFLIMNRFTSTFSDPNNAAIVFVAVLTYLLFNCNQSFGKNLLLILMTGVIVAATMSATGFVLYGTTLSFYFLKILIRINFFTFKKSSLLTFILLATLSPFIYIAINSFLDSAIVQISLARVSENTADSRFLIWKNLLESENIFKYIFIGMGGSIVVFNDVYAPHNGNLHLIYNYGMIAYVLFMLIFFRKRRNTNFFAYLFLVIFFIGFTMNVGIYEPRFINILSLLVASYAVANGITKRSKRLNRDRETF